MPQVERANLQALLAAPTSPLRSELLQLGFDALAAQPLSGLLGDPALVPTIYTALNRDNTKRIAERHVLPGLERLRANVKGRPERVRDALPTEAQQELARLVAEGKGPRLSFMRGAIDPADLRQLFAPVVQQVLVQFTTKLPIPGLGGAGAGSGGGGLGGLVGMIGKQVSKSAGQLADVGKSVMGGIGSELERRMQQMARDFSQTAMTEFRTAIAERIKSDEGQELIGRMRDRVLEHLFEAKLEHVVEDMLRLPAQDIARMSESIVEHDRDQPLFRKLVEAEIAAALQELGGRSFADVLTEAGLLDQVRGIAMNAVEPGLKTLVASDAFGGWLDRLLAQASTP